MACWFVHGRICKQARRRRLVLLLAKKGKRACEAPATTAQCVAHKEKGGVKKGRISHPASKNQNKQANKERTKQKQGAKAGQVTEKRGEKGRERSSFHPSPSHALSRSISSISSNSISAFGIGVDFPCHCFHSFPLPLGFFFVCFGHKAKERRLEEDTSYLPSHATNVNCRG